MEQEKPRTLESMFGVLPTPAHYASFECAYCFAERDKDPSIIHDCKKCPHCQVPPECMQ